MRNSFFMKVMETFKNLMYNADCILLIKWPTPGDNVK